LNIEAIIINSNTEKMNFFTCFLQQEKSEGRLRGIA